LPNADESGADLFPTRECLELEGPSALPSELSNTLVNVSKEAANSATLPTAEADNDNVSEGMAVVGEGVMEDTPGEKFISEEDGWH
jgi:hypothetical protein